MNRFKSKVIAVTGGGSGIGEAIVRRLSSEGARVAVIDVDMANAERVAGEVENASAYAGDVSKLESMTSVFEAIVKEHGRLDGAVNNAGIGGPFLPSVDYPLELWDRIIAVNLNGTYYSIRAELPHLIAGGGGPIVNVASVAGVLGNPQSAAYVASKHGVVGLTKTIAHEYGTQGVRCNAVCPSFIPTPMTKEVLKEEKAWREMDALHATGRCATPEDVAGMVVFLLSDDARSVTGSTHLVDGGIAAR